jgi:O-antigen/teichoic acid export membrane protein
MQLSLTQIAALGSGKLLRVPLAIGFMWLLATTLGPAGMGRWAMVLAVSTLFHGLLLSWLQAAHVRFGREEWMSNGTVSRTWAARWPLISLGFAVSTLLLVTEPFDFLGRFFGLTQGLWPLVVLLMLGQWCSAEAQSLYRLMGKVNSLALIPAAMDFAMIAIVGLMLLAPVEERAHWTILSLALTITLGWGIAWSRVFFATASSHERPTLPALRKTVQYSWPLLPAFLFAYLSNWGDHIVLQYFRTIEEVGLFDAAYQVMVALQAFASPFAILLLPRLVDRKVTMGDRPAELDYVTRLVPTLLVIWLALVVPGLIFVPWFFALVFGPEFAASQQVLLVLCAAVPGAGFTALYAVLFETQGRLGRSAAMAAAMVAVNLVIAAALAQEYGAVGAAIGALCGSFVIQGLYLSDQHRFLSTRCGRSYALLVFSSTYSLLQILTGPEVLARTLLAAGGLIALACLVRRSRLMDEPTLAELLPESWRGTVLPYLRPLCTR